MRFTKKEKHTHTTQSLGHEYYTPIFLVTILPPSLTDLHITHRGWNPLRYWRPLWALHSMPQQRLSKQSWTRVACKEGTWPHHLYLSDIHMVWQTDYLITVCTLISLSPLANRFCMSLCFWKLVSWRSSLPTKVNAWKEPIISRHFQLFSKLLSVFSLNAEPFVMCWLEKPVFPTTWKVKKHPNRLPWWELCGRMETFWSALKFSLDPLGNPLRMVVFPCGKLMWRAILFKVI